jgi:hypothetical protein
MSDIDNVVIVPSQQTNTFTVTNFRMTVTRVVLFTSVSVNVQLLDASGNLVGVRNLDFSGDQYQQWTNNDQTLVNMVAETLGFTIQPGQGF